jgi:membrane complex biogenesis BtpA family protein
MVHLLPTPGSPGFRGSVDEIVERAISDARCLADNGCHALLVENYGDVPFHRDAVPAETVASMALCVSAVVDAVAPLTVGVNVLRNDARAGLALCAATGARFVRVNVHLGVRATDQGVLEGRAFETMRERTRLCPEAAVLADAQVKHSTALGARSLAEDVGDLVARGLVDAVIVTGIATGVPPDAERLREAQRAAAGVPVLIGSGFDELCAPELLRHADGVIVGTSLKHGGRVENPVDAVRVGRLARAIRASVRSGSANGDRT